MLAGQIAPSGAEGQADAGLETARLVFHEPQVGEVGGGDQQQQHHDAEQHGVLLELGPQVAFGERDDARRAVRPGRAAVAIHLAQNGIGLDLRLAERRAGRKRPINS